MYSIQDNILKPIKYGILYSIVSINKNTGTDTVKWAGNQVECSYSWSVTHTINIFRQRCRGRTEKNENDVTGYYTSKMHGRYVTTYCLCKTSKDNQCISIRIGINFYNAVPVGGAYTVECIFLSYFCTMTNDNGAFNERILSCWERHENSTSAIKLQHMLCAQFSASNFLTDLAGKLLIILP